jgi:hypothetical protein
MDLTILGQTYCVQHGLCNSGCSTILFAVIIQYIYEWFGCKCLHNNLHDTLSIMH